MTGRQIYRVALVTPEAFYALDCEEDEHIWDAAAVNGVVLPAICHHGRCLTCAGRLLEGTVAHDQPDAYFTEDEAEGYVLLCRAMPRSDVRIRTHQEWAMRNHRISLGLPAHTRESREPGRTSGATLSEGRGLRFRPQPARETKTAKFAYEWTGHDDSSETERMLDRRSKK